MPRRIILATLFLLICCRVGYCLDGTNPLRLTVSNDWQAFEIVTQLDNIAGIADPGYGSVATRGLYDGLGAFRITADQLAITLNHETIPAAISGLTLDLPSFREAIQSTIDMGVTPFPTSFVQRMGYAYQTIFDGSYHAMTNPNPAAVGSGVVTYGNINFSRFCSGTTHAANTFGLNQGFVDPIYITGEEVSGGKFYALDVTTNTLWEAPDLGLGAWENAAPIDTGNMTHTAMLLNSDQSSSPGAYLQMYVGTKNVDVNSDGVIDFLERNGLRGGDIYYFVPDGGASTTDLPDGVVTGKWQSSTTGALRETKLEDVHTNPADGNQLVFADQTDGVYVLDSVLAFAGGALDPGTTTVTISQIDDNDVGPIGAPDNLVWSGNGNVYVQEDGDGNGMFEIDMTSMDVTQIATGLSEPSGIVDISSLVGYTDGSVMLTSLQGTTGAGAQLSVLIAPDAAAVQVGDFDGNQAYECADVDALVAEIVAQTHDPMFDITGDGLVDAKDLAAWRAEAGAANLTSGNAYLIGDANLDGIVDGPDFVAWLNHKFTATAAWCSADFNADGSVDGQDFVLWNDNKFWSADHGIVAVPSPTGMALGWYLALVGCLHYRREPLRLL